MAVLAAATVVAGERTVFLDDPLLVAGAAAATQLPWLVLTVPAGPFIDRFDRRTLMMAAHAAHVIVGVALGLLLLSGHGSGEVSECRFQGVVMPMSARGR